MDYLSPYILAGLVGWLVAQGLKFLFLIAKHRKVRGWKQLYLSGGLPSAHTTTVISVWVVVGLRDGITSAVFGLATLVAAVVMYDSLMVRRSSGEQGAALTALIKEQKSGVALPRVAKGHTPIEVAVGILVGLIVGFIVFYTTK